MSFSRLFNGPLSRTTRISQYQKNIHSLTSCLCSYYTTPLINFIHFLWPTASSLRICWVWQCFSVTSLPSFLWSASRSYTFHFITMHFFTQSFLSFLTTCPYYLNLYCCTSVIISSIPSLSLNSLNVNLSAILTTHIHLIILISACWPCFTVCNSIFAQYRTN